LQGGNLGGKKKKAVSGEGSSKALSAIRSTNRKFVRQKTSRNIERTGREKVKGGGFFGREKGEAVTPRR